MKKLIVFFIFVPLIVASLLTYRITISEDQAQAFINKSLPVHVRGIPSYKISAIYVKFDQQKIESRVLGEIDIRSGIKFDTTISGQVKYVNTTFYLTNTNINNISYTFNDTVDEALILGGKQAVGSWLSKKLEDLDVDTTYKNSIKDSFNKNDFIEKFINSLNIPLYSIEKAPFLVRVFGATIDEVIVGDQEIVITYSPRIIWVLILTSVAAAILTLALFTPGAWM